MIKRLGRRFRRTLPLALALVVVPSASAAVKIHAVDTSGFPSIRATLIEPVGAPAPQVRENGKPVVGLSAVNLGRAKAIVLALDRSQSMRGKPLASAVTAAQSFISAAGADDHVGLVTFGRSAFALTAFSLPPADARTALDGLAIDAHSGTALYDAVALAANRLALDERPGRAIVVVTDGSDVSSTHTLEQAIAAAHAARAAVYAIGIGGPSFTPDALRELAAQTGGSYHQATSAAQLGNVYSALAHELARTWQVSYLTSAPLGGPVRIDVRVPGAGAAHAQATMPGRGSAPTAATGLIPSFGYSTAGTLALGLVVGLLVLVACCFWFAARRGSVLRARIEPHLGAVVKNRKAQRQKGRAAARSHLADWFEGAFGELRQFKRLQLTIDRGDLPLRAGELITMCAGSGILFGLFVAITGAPTIVILLAMAVFGCLPLGYVSLKGGSRMKKFENQLPDLLITIAASLKAGHSFRQGIQSVVDEGAEPAAKEFRRVLNETQLGKPMDDALADLGKRIDSENLTFVINAVTIQRQIGGSLAGLFDMVADTVRQRQQFGRKVKGLTAMGRMSAYVLAGLPFFVGLVVTMMNPSYMAPLYHTASGQKMIGIGAGMIVVGSLMLKKIVSFRG
jgi:tight adherence protein B